MNILEQLRSFTVVVADTGDFQSIEKYRPVDATTNPSLIYAAAQNPAYHHLIDKALAVTRGTGYTAEEHLDQAIDRLSVGFGIETLKIVPGRVSTEVNADLSFDIEASIGKARKLIGMYEAADIGRDRILIKLA